MRHNVNIVSDPIDIGSVLSEVRTPAAGAIVSFMGTVRDLSDGLRVNGMELEAAVDLASADLDRIVAQAGDRFEVSKMSVVHRIGKLQVGDTIIVIAVSAPHRPDAFDACEFIIDELKKSTPIWKKEFSEKETRWVRGEH